jgi:hypothetical protein
LKDVSSELLGGFSDFGCFWSLRKNWVDRYRVFLMPKTLL